MAIEYDDNGWLVGSVTPLPLDASFSLFSPTASSQLYEARLRGHAERFFQIGVSLSPEKRYPGGGWPRHDRARLTVSQGERVHAVEVVTLPCDHAPDVVAAGAAGARAIGGAGFDVLVGRGQRVWQLDGTGDGALAAALALASLLLAPILPPGGGEIYGVKTARLRLHALGWKV